ERPSREVLFTVVDAEEKYKAKSFIDTVVFRGGDAASLWAYDQVGKLAPSRVAITAGTGIVCAAWLILAYYSARRQARGTEEPAGRL
ncbi:MAG TPA: hypothetical protein VMR65_04625, partial [Candidatus Sulfotelmatobacter sp.]|nr:hypothetical protein [Candidatus Sulfotelmatobacter sp.]